MAKNNLFCSGLILRILRARQSFYPLWLVNTMVKQGWKIEPGHIIITGALGRMVPGKPGNYIAEYGSLGTIPFKIN